MGGWSWNAQIGPPCTCRIVANGASPRGSVQEALDLEPVGRRPAHAPAIADRLTARRGAGVGEVGERHALGAVDERRRPARRSQASTTAANALPEPDRRGRRVVAAAARAGRRPRSRSPRRSAASTSSATGSRPRTPIASSRASSRQAVHVTSTPCGVDRPRLARGGVDQQQVRPPRSRDRCRRPRPPRRGCRPARRRPSRAGRRVRRSVRAVRAAGSISASSARYQAPSPAPSETIATMRASPHQAASQTLSRSGEAWRSSPLATSRT